MTKDEYSKHFAEINKELIEKEHEIEKIFWAAHGGRPKGKGDITRHLFDEVNAEFLKKWQKLKDEYVNSQ